MFERILIVLLKRKTMVCRKKNVLWLLWALKLWTAHCEGEKWFIITTTTTKWQLGDSWFSSTNISYNKTIPLHLIMSCLNGGGLWTGLFDESADCQKWQTQMSNVQNYFHHCFITETVKDYVRITSETSQDWQQSLIFSYLINYTIVSSLLT